MESRDRLAVEGVRGRLRGKQARAGEGHLARKLDTSVVTRALARMYECAPIRER